MDGWLYRPAPLLGAMAVVCFGAVGLALVSQYRFDMQPCPWCTLQRLIFLLIGLLALLGTLLRSNGIRRVLAVGGLLLALCGMASAICTPYSPGGAPGSASRARPLPAPVPVPPPAPGKPVRRGFQSKNRPDTGR